MFERRREVVVDAPRPPSGEFTDGQARERPSAPTRPPLAHLSVAEFAALRAAGRAGGVDAYLPVALEGAHFETWVVGGREPERVVELLEQGTTAGTRIGTGPLLRWPHG